MKILMLLSLMSFLIACSTVPQREGVIKLHDGSASSPLINIQVSGQEKIVNLDSGANIPFLKPLSAAPNNNDRRSETNLTDVFGQNIKTVSVANMDYKVGPLEIKNVRTNFSTALKSEAIPLSLIKSAKMTFDFSKSEIKMGETATFCDPKSQLRNVKGLTYVRIRIGDEKHWLLWDTGAATSILNESLEKKYEWTPSKEMAITIKSPENQQTSAPTKLFVTSIKISGQNEDLYFITRDIGTTLAVINKNADGILGYNFIKKYKWYFDFSNGNYCLAKN